MKHRIELPEDLDALVNDLKNLSWEVDGIEDALLGVKEFNMEAEYLAGGLVKVTCYVKVFPRDFVGATSTSWIEGLAPVELLGKVVGAVLGKSTDVSKDLDPPFNRVTEVRYLRAPDTDEGVSRYVADHLMALLERAASL